MWLAWKMHGVLPRQGGWQEQPLHAMAEILAIDLIVETVQYLTRSDADWSKLTATQLALLRWLEESDEDSGASVGAG